MLCMTPVKCRGPPIFLPHPPFATYVSLSMKALTTMLEARIGLRPARALRDTMANHLHNERARKESFLQATRRAMPICKQADATK